MINKTAMRASFSKAFKGVELLSTSLVDFFDSVSCATPNSEACTEPKFDVRNHQVYPFPESFDAQALGATTRLHFPLGDIEPDEISVRHDENTVLLTICPHSQGYLIDNLEFWLTEVKPEYKKELVESFAHLRWNTCTASDLNKWVRSWIKLSGGEGDDMWAGRALRMIKPLNAALVELRDKGALIMTMDVYRESMSLDGYMHVVENKALSEALCKPLWGYLHELPAFNKDDMFNGTVAKEAYTQHAYLSMQITTIFCGGSYRGKDRGFRMGNASVEYKSDRVIHEITATVARGELIVELVFGEPGLKTIPIKNLCKI